MTIFVLYDTIILLIGIVSDVSVLERFYIGFPQLTDCLWSTTGERKFLVSERSLSYADRLGTLISHGISAPFFAFI